MATHSSSPSQDDFSAVSSFKGGERDLLAHRKRRPRGSEFYPSSGLGGYCSESVQLQSTGPAHARSVEKGAVNTATCSSELDATLDSDSAGPAHKQIVETEFSELKDGTLVELVQDPENPHRTLLAVWKDGEVRCLDQLEHDGQVLVPLPRTNEIFKQLRLPTEAGPYESVQILLSRLECLISRCVSVDTAYVAVLADFVLSTWFVDRFMVAPYLSVVGLPQSGKTTLLKVLSLVCRRPLLIADITSASFYRVCAQFMPTMLIDEAGSVRNNRALRHMLRTGTTRDVNSVVANQVLHSYGAKVISWLEPPDDAALNSRCVLIPMCEMTKTDLARVSDPDVEREAAILQTQFLQFRFENYKRIQVGPIPGDEVLRPRSRDLLRTLSAAHLQDAKRSERLLRFFDSGQAVPLEPLSPEQNAVLRGLFSIIHTRKDYCSVETGDLTAAVNYLLERASESLRLQPRKVGAVLTSLGFSNRKRTNSGWVVYLDREDALKVHQLAEWYGIEGLNKRLLLVSRDDCDLCKAEKCKRPSISKEYTSIPLDLGEELGRR